MTGDTIPATTLHIMLSLTYTLSMHINDTFLSVQRLKVLTGNSIAATALQVPPHAHTCTPTLTFVHPNQSSWLTHGCESSPPLYTDCHALHTQLTCLLCVQWLRVSTGDTITATAFQVPPQGCAVVLVTANVDYVSKKIAGRATALELDASQLTAHMQSRFEGQVAVPGVLVCCSPVKPLYLHHVDYVSKRTGGRTTVLELDASGLTAHMQSRFEGQVAVGWRLRLVVPL